MVNFNPSTQIPSCAVDLLRSFMGRRLIRLVRYSWWPKENVPNECLVQPLAAFSLTAGPLAMTFESGETLGIASSPSLNSVVVWIDRASDGSPMRVPPMDEDTELFPIESSDVKFSQPIWSGLLGSVLHGASVLRFKSASALKNELPSEVGLCFEFEAGETLIASHGLHDGSDDFAVLKVDQIEPSLHQLLEERRLL